MLKAQLLFVVAMLSGSLLKANVQQLIDKSSSINYGLIVTQIINCLLGLGLTLEHVNIVGGIVAIIINAVFLIMLGIAKWRIHQDQRKHNRELHQARLRGDID